ncbi:hypothetical protein PIB30_073984 [Stylosanthes scabra]|uniref:COP1-interacting protein 7 n=1 Tax=Stylosanthes scabra TaxID=79078 RepID=A0ABU6QQL6_9FABA|nr:hypothetical protein [Stylosanthes scabra]
MDRDSSQSRDRQKKGSRSGRKKSGMVVIRNINYITKAENSSGSESYSDSASEIDEGQDTQESVKTSKRRDKSESGKKLNLSDKEVDRGNDADGGHWQAFQSCLLRDADEDRHAIDQEQFDLPNTNSIRRKKHVAGDDPLVSSERDMLELQGSGSMDMHSISQGLRLKPRASDDDLSLSAKEGHSGDGRSIDVHSLEVNGIRRGYRTVGNDDIIIPNHEGHFGNSHPSSDMEAVSGLGYSNNKMERKLFHDMNDDSYIVDHRSVAVNDVGHDERNAIDMDSEFPTARLKEEKSSNGIKYEPDELSMMPERGAEMVSMSYDPALDYEMMAKAEGSSLQDKNNKGVLTEESKKPDKEQKSKATPNSSDKKKAVGPIRRGKPSKLSPLDEARARADRLRNYKADLQKMKKEKEEEEIKRLEALKLERQKRIAAKSGTVTTKSPITKKQSPSSHKGSKFSDSEPALSSPLQRFPIKTASTGSSDYSKVSRTSKLNTGSQSSENKLSRSVSSLPESKLEKGEGTTDTKASMARIRRLSEPKMSTVHQTSSAKPHKAVTISKTKSVDVPESKKISAIVNYDKSKTAALPELKIRTPTASDVQNKLPVKEKTQKLNGNKSSVNSDSSLAKKNETQTSLSEDQDDNPVVEKTVVMLECEKPYTPAVHKSEEKTETPKKQYDNEGVKEKSEPASQYVAIRAPVSPPSMDMIDIATSGSQSHLPPVSTEVKLNDTEKEHSKSFNISDAGETYQAPYARVSSLEDPSTRNTEYGKAVPTILETTAVGVETIKAHVSDTRNSTLEKIPEAVEKPQVKESSKGFGRLFKFGKKSHSSANSGHNIESDNLSNDGAEADEIGTNGSSNEVHTLKNLISQDETPTTSSTQQKSSRSFSLLSPFRSKNSEKKINMA